MGVLSFYIYKFASLEEKSWNLCPNVIRPLYKVADFVMECWKALPSFN